MELISSPMPGVAWRECLTRSLSIWRRTKASSAAPADGSIYYCCLSLARVQQASASEATMADTAEMRECGGTLMFIGLAVWVADLLVVFFLPAGIRAGMHT